MARRAAGARLFTALTLPESVGGEIAAWARGWLSVPGLRLVAQSSLHLTLSFVGERPLSEIDTLRVVVESFTGPAPHLALGAPTLLPERSPRTVGLEIRDLDGTLADLQALLERRLAEAIEWQPAARRFYPHVTVARTRQGVIPDRAPPTPDLAFEPRTIALVRSRLDPSGAQYETLAQSDLPTR